MLAKMLVLCRFIPFLEPLRRRKALLFRNKGLHCVAIAAVRFNAVEEPIIAVLFRLIGYLRRCKLGGNNGGFGSVKRAAIIVITVYYSKEHSELMVSPEQEAFTNRKVK